MKISNYNHRSKMTQHEFPRSQIIFLSTFIAIILLFSISYQANRLPSLRINLHHTNTSQTLPGQALKVAVIIENRPSANLVPLILHFKSVLGPEWPIKVFHSAENLNIFSDSPAFQRQTSSGHIDLHQLPSNITLKDHESVSQFLTRSWLWERLAPHKHILFFQADSILCANSPFMVEDFLHYDFVGAPIDPNYGHGYNGGLSLRNREKFLEVTQRWNFTGNGTEGSRFEDQWFYEKLQELPTGPHSEPGANLPSWEVATKFAVETIWHKQPFGLHQVSRWQRSHATELSTWCPEHLMAGDAGFFP